MSCFLSARVFQKLCERLLEVRRTPYPFFERGNFFQVLGIEYASLDSGAIDSDVGLAQTLLFV